MLKKNLVALALAVAASNNAFAGIPLVTDDTGTQGTGGNQLEFAFARDKNEDSSIAKEFAVVYTRGIAETVDVFIEKGRQTNTDASGASTSGLGNTVIGAKWRAWENERKTSFAIKGTFALPLGEEKEIEGWGTGKTSYEATLILTQEMAWGSVNANLGTGREKYSAAAKSLPTDAKEDAKSTHFSVAPVFNLNEQVKLAIDLGVDRSKTDTGSEKSRYGEIGIMYSPSESIDLGLGFIRTTDEDSKDVTNIVTGGLTWRFK